MLPVHPPNVQEIAPARYLLEGGHRLSGRVRVSGAKNATLPVFAACLLTAEPCRITNVPEIDDVYFMAEILRSLGADIERDPACHDQYHVRAGGVGHTVAPTELVMHLRGSFLVMGALLARYGEAACSPPGGDVIGERPLDVHLGGFSALGAEVSREGDKYRVRARRLHGARVFLDYPSVLGTENVLLAATLARGSSVIINAAAEPEIVSLAAMLNDMGARIEGAGTHTIEIEGVEELHGVTHRIIPDRIEAGTFAIAAALTGGDVTLAEALPGHNLALIAKLQEAGAVVEETEAGLRIAQCGPLRPLSVQALPYPGLATDLQALVAVLLTQAHGVSTLHERVYENRMLYIGELRRFGAEIVSAGPAAVISGPTPLLGAAVRALDVRAGAALMLAGLAARGETQISDIYHLDRGYEALDTKLRGLGAVIRRV
jgi:UDP-N-acetylglucosamine 1-carboxyvinyltransferase